MKYAIFIAFLCLLASPAAWSCDSASKTEAGDLGWIRSDKLMYGLDADGLFETHLNSPSKKQLAKAAGKFKRQLTMSPNGKYLFFAAADDNVYGAKTRYYLYDVAAGKASELQGMPETKSLGQLEFIGFSPDSAWIAWQDNKPFEGWRWGKGIPTLLVYSTAKPEQKQIDFPREFGKSDQIRNCFTSQWSADGKALYSNLIASDKMCGLSASDQRNVIYFKAEVKTGAITKIDGGYTFDDHTGRFKNWYKDDGSTLQLAYACTGSGDCGYRYDEPHTAGDSRAYMKSRGESNYGASTDDLVAVARGAEPATVETGQSSFCEGSNLTITGWMEGGKYLIYDFNGKPHVYGIAEKKKSALPQVSSGPFVWAPAQTTEYKYSQGGGSIVVPSHMY